jgi:STAS-like domain of unknown function (DUF4325)
MNSELRLKQLGGAFLGTRFEGRSLRMELEKSLSATPCVSLDFSDVTVSQSCADEFLGVLVAQQGGDLLEHLTFRNCSADVRAVLELVIGARLQDHDQLVCAHRTHEQLLNRTL